MDDDGNSVGVGGGGLLAITEPWPSMLRGIWGDPERFVETYWEKFAEKGYYFAGDGARFDEDGDLWLLGRVDDVMNVSGHRLSTAEIESAWSPTRRPPRPQWWARPTRPRDRPSSPSSSSRRATSGALPPEGLAHQLRGWVGEQIGPIARPRDVYIVGELPKTRSGKIMRRLLRDVAEGREVGDTTTLADTAVMSVISAQVK